VDRVHSLKPLLGEEMTRSTLLDRLNQELEAFGKKAQAALDEGKLQIELLRLRRRLDRAARDLGLVVHRRERGGDAEPRRFDALMLRLDDLQAEIARLERQIAEARGGGGAAGSTGSRTPPAEIRTEPTGTPPGGE
jgi:outer membrane murein-binding lipoprotein Lpp